MRRVIRKLKLYIDMNIELRKKAENDLGNDFFKLMKNEVFVKAMKKLRSPRDSKLVTTKTRRNYLVSEPNHHTTFFISFGKIITNKNEKTWIILNK